MRVVGVLLLTVLCARFEEVFVLTVVFVERVEPFVTVLALEALRLDTTSPLKEVLRPVVLVIELLRLDVALFVTVLRPFMADEEA